MMAAIRSIAYRFTTITKTMKPLSPELLSCQLCLINNLKQFSKSSGPSKVFESTRKVEKHVVPHIVSDNTSSNAQMRSYCTSKPPDVSEIRNINPLGNIQSKVYYFDTLAVVQKLMTEGFDEKQAIAIKDIVQEVLHSSIDHQTKVLVTKAQLEITTQQMMTHLNSVKKDLVILEKSEFSMLRSETEKQTMEIQQLKKYLENELDKLRGHVRLDINLEKSRATEAHAENEKNLQMLRNKIETDVANVRTLFESYKNDVFKYSIATALTAGATVLAVLRLLIH